VVASKSGETIETDSHRRAYLRAFEDAGLPDAGARFVFVTDPGSPFAALADEMGAQLFLADPEVGGRYSALTAFGVVPAALAGVDVAELLDQAEEFATSLGRRQDNPALTLGAALGAAAGTGRDKVALIEDGTGIVGLGDWIEQLLAESTGKRGQSLPGASTFGRRESDGRGILPVVLALPDSPGAIRDDVLAVTVGGSLPPDSVPGGGIAPHVAVNGPLGQQFLAWEYATAVAGLVLGINPFDQPNVAESKENTARILATGEPPETPAFVDGPIEVYGADLGHATTVDDALGWLLSRLVPGGYLAVTAFLDRLGQAGLARIRDGLADHTKRAVTFGWGPRYLHSTGQYHKGGPPNGAFLQITGTAAEDLPIPGSPYTFGRLEAAQAAGDREALAGRGCPLVRMHLTDRAAGVTRLLTAVDDLPWVS
jgi:glucose-6-phosphate isomerase